MVLKGGKVLVHDAHDNIQVREADVLIENNLIAKISPDIDDVADAEVIDCHMKIVSPGFVDTHHHLWQTQLKGRHANELLLEYLASGNLQSSNYTREDLYWGQLGGCLEAINAGTTTVVDHSHINTFQGAGKSDVRTRQSLETKTNIDF
jgi:cytosine/adenosine deaminase-related metal-dependent hydrolase